MQTQKIIYDVLIAGQGAAAFSAALYAARYQINSIVIGEIFGGETATGGLIENYPGYPEIDGFELMMKFREHAEKYNVPVFDDKVTKISKNNNLFEISTYDDSLYTTRSIILAVGRERRKLGLSNEDEWTGKGVSFCSTCDAPLHQGNTVAVVGGGNAATEGAVLLSKYANEVYIIYRKPKFTRAEPINIQLLNETPNIKQILETNVVELIGNGGLESVVLDNPYNGSSKLSLDGIFIEIGADPRVDLPNQVGLNLNDQNEVVVDKNMNTNVPGIFGAGDLTDASGTLKQTVTAAAQGAIAATSAYSYLTKHSS